MPVTAKLSRRFYDQLGDDVANELVNWFNAVDETYRNQLRRMFGFWTATVIPLAALILALNGVFQR